MGIVFDHAFVFSAPGAPAADALVSAGLVEGAPNVHEGQGTRNRRFFFSNGMLEFLWVYSQEDACDDRVADARLLERSRFVTNGACPFGIAFGWTGEGNDLVPFETWAYRPPYLPEGLMIPVADASRNLEQPFVFLMPGTVSKRSGGNAMSVVHISLRYPGYDEAHFGQSLGDDGAVELGAGPAPLMVMKLEGALSGAGADLRPHLPLVLEW